MYFPNAGSFELAGCDDLRHYLCIYHCSIQRKDLDHTLNLEKIEARKPSLQAPCTAWSLLAAHFEITFLTVCDPMPTSLA